MIHLTRRGFSLSETSPHVSPIDDAVSSFQSAFARLCDVSARALHDGARRSDVLEAFRGRGAGPDLQALRAHRRHVNHRVQLVKHLAANHGIGDRIVATALVRAGRVVREVAESEWCVTLPIVNPNP